MSSRIRIFSSSRIPIFPHPGFTGHKSTGSGCATLHIAMLRIRNQSFLPKPYQVTWTSFTFLDQTCIIFFSGLQEAPGKAFSFPVLIWGIRIFYQYPPILILCLNTIKTLPCIQSRFFIYIICSCSKDKSEVFNQLVTMLSTSDC
jgi:hypothetical protein